ncbi:hypothetical protein ACQ7DA_06745 [Zafaria sp. J156]|uniref:hypothetical protein n=1 Tax=Zafaria sp. J156 TaxID=3116490 RepID=UPI002E77C66A|nr:hypothetical protein [Zafaria sp. J156]MEE1620929.1 hypothetical protein [Zafaria sp. J156]
MSSVHESAPAPRPAPRTAWAPRHRGLKLAHHLVPAFVVIAVLLGLGAASVAAGKPLLAAPMAALAFGVGRAVLHEFRRGEDWAAPTGADVETSSGPRAATWFPSSPVSLAGGAVTVGVAVVTVVGAIATEAKTVLLGDGGARVLTATAAAGLLVVGFLVLREGLRMLRLAASGQAPGVYLTRSRIVVVDRRGHHEAYWKDVVSVVARDPRGRKPLGDRGPALIEVHTRASEAGRRTRPLIVDVQELDADPGLLLRTLGHYAAHAADRPELGTEKALSRLDSPTP